jgi:hypothetical protein
MSVTITVNDPANTPRQELIAVLDFLARYAGFTGAAAPVPQVTPAPEPAPVITPQVPDGVDIGTPQAQHRTDLPIVPPMPSPPPPPPMQGPGIDVDAAGLPWDGRIHASTRAKNVDGTWRSRRGVDDAIVSTVMEELRVTMGAPAVEPPPVVIAPPPPSVGSVVPPAPPASSTPTESAGAAPIASPSNLFPALMRRITEAFTSGALTQATIQQAVAKAGVPSLPMLASRPDLIPAVAAELGFAL